jgi:asparagine synthase (glutamine-hydrolysing)
MCGIAGAIGICDDGALVKQMTAALRHRGPDSVGHCSRGMYHIGAARLNIIDLTAGAQPIYNETGRACVVFNGEIYNHRELRADLQRKGHTFKTQTDTEVIIHLYEEMGDDLVRDLRGMFAFAVFDGSRVLLARDRLGIKPLYFATNPGQQLFLFASEIKAIIRHPGFAPRLDLQTLADAIALGHAVDDRTFFEGVRSLRPGHTLVVSCNDGLQVGTPRSYYSADVVRDEGADLDEMQAALEHTVDRAVLAHLGGDVEVGLTLSGGIDSSILALFARRHVQRPMSTFAVADHDEHADVVQAKRVAQMIGSTHQTVVMSFDDYLDVIPGLIESEEQPTSLYGAPFYFLCRVIANRIKATLHGEGADELFGGYEQYLDREARVSQIRRRLPLLKHLGVAPSDRAVESIKRLSAPNGFDEYLRHLFADNMGDPLERQHLVPVDKCAMAAGLEIRVPYLDAAVVELANTMPLDFLVRPDLGIRKYILRRLVLSRFGNGMMDVVLREKLGAPAAGKAHLERFTRLCNEILPDKYVISHEFGRCFPSKRELILFDMFLEVFMKHRGDGAAMGSVVDFIRTRDVGSTVSGAARHRAVSRTPEVKAHLL